ncbi:DEAD/DEAH box helicase [Sphingomonas cavernae]|uniref:DEAD/DEAH box helicase n=1 Tax=Sphingomonas cavernae TaxID=2320861 RepID=A0A418WK35_9SPHN|nr:DEAD/DEAH box helicase [Sphingomonas cavernae]RJF90394.1 DEAD/DEAH box helicase [Sphingomonas cavernae]
MTRFTDLGLAEPIIKALAAKGYDKPTPIQVQSIPPLLEGRDLCGIAQTGTGKTAAFALPSLDYFARNPKPRPLGSCRMLVLSPTRELASQIATSFRDYGHNLRLSVEVVFGGVPIGRQISKLKAGADIVVATPGRLLDLIDQRAFHLRDVEIFVLDEADQMMDLGFIVPLKRIDKLLPTKRQSLFFSATMPKAIAELGDRFLTDPIKVSVAPQSTTAERVRQYVSFVNQKEKQALLTLTLKAEPIERALVFTRTKHGADRVVKHLVAAGVGALAIHGNKSQPQRTAALQAFRNGEIKILVATDIAARGIDVPGVSHVFNFEMPNVPEQYVHRIGRTARAGAEGVSISFVDGEEKQWLKQIERLTRVKLDTVPLPEDFLAQAAKLPQPPRSAPSAAQPGKRRHDDRGGEARTQQPAGDKTKRPFHRRRKGAPGAHKGAVKRFGSR